jgi:hypothetical protein
MKKRVQLAWLSPVTAAASRAIIVTGVSGNPLT